MINSTKLGTKYSSDAIYHVVYRCNHLPEKILTRYMTPFEDLTFYHQDIFLTFTPANRNIILEDCTNQQIKTVRLVIFNEAQFLTDDRP